MSTAPKNKKVLQDFPVEMKTQMKEFQDVLSQLKTTLFPLMEGYPTLEAKMENNALDSARLDLTTVYAMNSLFWVYLILEGENPKDHDVMRELNRLKASMKRFKELESRQPNNPSINVPAAARVIRNALFDPKATVTTNDLRNQKQEDEEEGGRKKKKLRKK